MFWFFSEYLLLYYTVQIDCYSFPILNIKYKITQHKTDYYSTQFGKINKHKTFDLNITDFFIQRNITDTLLYSTEESQRHSLVFYLSWSRVARYIYFVGRLPKTACSPDGISEDFVNFSALPNKRKLGLETISK